MDGGREGWVVGWYLILHYDVTMTVFLISTFILLGNFS